MDQIAGIINVELRRKEIKKLKKHQKSDTTVVEGVDEEEESTFNVLQDKEFGITDIKDYPLLSGDDI